MTLTMAEFSILHWLQTETEIIELSSDTVLSSDTFQDVQNSNGKQSVAIFHVTLSVNFKGIKSYPNHTIQSELKPLFDLTFLHVRQP